MTPKSPAITSRSGSLRVRFFWTEDRFGHSVDWTGSIGDEATIFTSIEGTADDSWPPSPPFQEVEPHTSGSGTDCLLAVGIAGTSHWSAAIEEVLDERSSEERTIFRFDVACRLKGPAEELKSTYRLGESLSRNQGNDPSFTDSSGHRFQVISHSTVTTEGGSLVIIPKPSQAAEPATARWMYDLLITAKK